MIVEQPVAGSIAEAICPVHRETGGEVVSRIAGPLSTPLGGPNLSAGCPPVLSFARQSSRGAGARLEI